MKLVYNLQAACLFIQIPICFVKYLSTLKQKMNLEQFISKFRNHLIWTVYMVFNFIIASRRMLTRI